MVEFAADFKSLRAIESFKVFTFENNDRTSKGVCFKQVGEYNVNPSCATVVTLTVESCFYH